MKNSDLIKTLQMFDGELEVTTSDKKGTFQDISSVELQKWGSGKNTHSSVTLVLGGYDSRKTLVNDSNKNTVIEIELGGNDDEEFIDNVNNELSEGCSIDKEEALEAKKAFDVDIADMQKKYKEWFNKKYDTIAREAMTELFGSDKPLDHKTISELKLHIYENGWRGEIDKDDFNNRSEVLRLLYHKLDDRVKEKLSEDTEKLLNDINNCEDDSEDNIENHHILTVYDLIDKNFFNTDWLKDFPEEIKKFGNLNLFF